MKRAVFFIALLAAILASCSNDYTRKTSIPATFCGISCGTVEVQGIDGRGCWKWTAREWTGKVAKKFTAQVGTWPDSIAASPFKVTVFAGGQIIQ